MRALHGKAIPSSVALVAASLACISLGLTCLLYVALPRLLRRAPRAPSRFRPGVSILKPLKGIDDGLYENLASFARLEYAPFQIVFGAADPRDPALAVARRVQREFPAVDIVVHGGAPALGLGAPLGAGPIVPYLLRGADAATTERIQLLHDTKAYAYHIAEWLRRHHDDYHTVGLQEVFSRLRILRGGLPQRAYYRALSGYGTAIPHGVGFAGFRYENVLLSRLERAPAPPIHARLPGRIYRLAACGFTLAPFRWEGRTIWIGNTHLHPYNPRLRARQTESIVREVAALGDVPVLFMGDLNTVPPRCKEGDFPDGERDARSYKGDETLSLFARKAGLRIVHHKDDERYWTYPTGAPNRTLDYILFSRHWEVDSYRVAREFTLSDHYPVEGAFRLRRPRPRRTMDAGCNGTCGA
jgi:endonuclease/exonuclease/phosphatase family metal-dependent hydrolase